MHPTQRKSNLYFYLFCGLFVLITTAILALTKRLWWYYLAGALLGGITHILMLLQNRRFYQIQESPLEKAVHSPKKDSVLWYLLRLVLEGLYLAGIVFLATVFHRDRMLEVVILLLSGYMTVKVIFIVILLIFKEGR